MLVDAGVVVDDVPVVVSGMIGHNTRCHFDSVSALLSAVDTFISCPLTELFSLNRMQDKWNS